MLCQLNYWGWVLRLLKRPAPAPAAAVPAGSILIKQCVYFVESYSIGPIQRHRAHAAKRRNIIEPSKYCYITDIILVMRMDGLD